MKPPAQQPPAELQPGLTPSDYEKALHAQSAPNSGGLIHSLGEVIGRIHNQLRQDGEYTTDNVNSHPIVVLYTAQLLYLQGSTYPNCNVYQQAYYAACDIVGSQMPGVATGEDSPC